MEITTDQVLASLKDVLDPELGINVVDLGLIYEINSEGSKISIDMTLTNPACPMAGMIATEVEQAVRMAFEDVDVEVSFIWDPPWTLERLSPEAKQQLGVPS